MTDLLPISLEDQRLCVERKLRLRRGVYPRQVAQRRMSTKTMDREIALMEAVLATLETNIVTAQEKDK